MNFFLLSIIISTLSFSHIASSLTIDGIDYSKWDNRLNVGQQLYSKCALTSDDDRFALAMHPNGNLILYYIESGNSDYGKIIWSTNTDQGNTNYNRFLIWQHTDGHMVLYTNTLNNNPPQALWDTGRLFSNPGYALLGNDGNFVLYDGNNNELLGFEQTYNYFPPPYKSLVTYIPIPGQTYEEAKAAGYEWCLSIGLINGNRDTHQVTAYEHNLYWCDNYGPANQNCKCLGFKVLDNYYYYKINGITYRLTYGGLGNEIGTCEYNVKASMTNSFISKWSWTQWNTLCHSNGSNGCCLEWDGDVQSFLDIIDGTNKGGREAKCQLGIKKKSCNMFGMSCRTKCVFGSGEGFGDRMEWN